MIVVSFSGKLKSGKTTAMSFLKAFLEAKGYKVAHYSFGTPLKNELWEKLLKDYGIPREHLNDPEFKDLYRVPMQWFGTDFVRRVDRNRWIRSAEETLVKYVEENFDIVLNDDTRFWNEASFAEKHGIIYRLMRNTEGPVSDHISETDLDLYPFKNFVFNNGSMDDLEAIIKNDVLPHIEQLLEQERVGRVE